MSANISKKPTRSQKIDSFHNVNVALEKYTACRNKYRECFIKWRKNRQANIHKIRLLIMGLEKTKNDCNITNLSSAVTGEVGGIITGIGLITIPLSCKYTNTVIKNPIIEQFCQ